MPVKRGLLILCALLLCSVISVLEAQNRMVAEWEPMQGVLIRHPFGIPLSLIHSMAEQDTVYILVESAAAQNQATYTLSSQSVNLANCRFVIAPTNSHWTRDWGPHSIFLNDSVGAIADPYFNGYPWVPGLRDNRAYELDNAVNAILADYLGLPLLNFPGFLTGGNFMTDGNHIAFSTAQMLNENTSLMTTDQFLDFASQLLGIQYYNFTINPEFNGIQHIDCWAKLLNEETVLVKQLPLGHPEYQRAETIAAQFAQSTTSYGNPYNVLRIYCDTYSGSSAAAYTNSLILNKRVFVPLFGIAADQAALQTYTEAMPGYEILGFEGAWYYYDALHCRVMGIADMQMLRIEHSPPNPQTSILHSSLLVSAKVRSYGNHSLLDSYPKVYYKVSPSELWQSVTMQAVNTGSLFQAEIPGLLDGDELHYYISVADVSGRTQTRPVTAPRQHFSTSITAPVATFDQHAESISTVLYPQPANEILNIRWSKQDDMPQSISLYNIKGQLLQRQFTSEASTGLSLDLRILAPASGVYLLKVDTRKGSYTHRVLVIK